MLQWRHVRCNNTRVIFDRLRCSLRPRMKSGSRSAWSDSAPSPSLQPAQRRERRSAEQRLPRPRPRLHRRRSRLQRPRKSSPGRSASKQLDAGAPGRRAIQAAHRRRRQTADAGVWARSEGGVVWQGMWVSWVGGWVCWSGGWGGGIGRGGACSVCTLRWRRRWQVDGFSTATATAAALAAAAATPCRSNRTAVLRCGAGGLGYAVECRSAAQLSCSSHGA